MKTIKIAVIAMMGMSLGVNAQQQVTLEGANDPNFVNKNGNVGIGTTSPSSELEIKSKSNNNAEIHINSATDGTPSIIRFQDANKNTWGFLSNYPSVDKFSLYNYHKGENAIVIDKESKVGIGTTNPESPLEIRQKEDPIRDRALVISEPNNSQKIYLHLADNASGEYGYFSLGRNTNLRGNGQVSSFDGALGIGTTNPGTWKLAVNGKIRAKEIKVETGWSDFVFYDNYKLPTLKEVENHIKEKGHLKDIPSAKEVEKNGIFLGEMDSKLLQKIEELTLYTIEQQKEINSQKKENEELKVLVKKLLKDKN